MENDKLKNILHYPFSIFHYERFNRRGRRIDAVNLTAVA